MAWFEVFIPGKAAATPGITLTIEAPNWIGALRSGLSNLGEGQEAISNVMCDIKEDNSIHVTDVSTNRIFRLREVQKPAAPKAPPAAAASADTGLTKGPRTLLEFQRPRFDEPPPVATLAPPSVTPPKHVDDADTIRQPAAPRPTSPLDQPTSQSTIEMSIPWAKMPAPSAAPLPSIAPAALSSPKPAVSPPAAFAEFPPPPSTPLAPPVSPPHELMLPQALAKPRQTSTPTPAEPFPAAASPTPAPSPAPAPAPTPKGYDITLANPKAPSQPPMTLVAQELPASLVTEQEPAPLSPAPAPAPDPAPAPSPPPSSQARQMAPVAEATGRVRKGNDAKESKAASDQTERLPRAPSSHVSAAPTPRGTPAPPPKRSSGQFENAPQPFHREVSRENPSMKPADGASADAIADAVAEVFDATHDLVESKGLTPAQIAEALLDIALAHIPAESGSFYLADLNARVLTFAAVRGPKAEEIIRANMTVPIGHGVVGICALEGICLRINDVANDPRHYKTIAGQLGYTPKDMLVASAEFEGRCFGAIQLINARAGFTAVHMEVLRYIGLTAAQLLERHFEST